MVPGQAGTCHGVDAGRGVSEPVTFADVWDSFVPAQARTIARWYGAYGVTYDDAYQEMIEFLLGTGGKTVRRCLAAEPQKVFQIERALLDKGRRYAEKEKAARVGYKPDDVLWYTASLIEGAMPLVMDETFDGVVTAETPDGQPASQNPGLVTMIVDIRRAISRCPAWVSDVFRDGQPGVAGWDEAVNTVLNMLGGESPGVGKRKVMSNAAAQSLTSHQEAS